ncbi:MAG: TRAP transporter substrate-binding protein [Chloroflexi bacterium]|nr:TRAP transporter substrate-binding protein [Chloroflexota bacterium]
MSKKERRVLFVGLLIIAVLVIGAFGCASPAPAPGQAPKPAAPAPAPAAPEKVYTMKVSSYGGPGYAPRTVLEKFMDIVKERSKGQVKFEYFAGGSLYSMEDAGEAARAGIIQIGHTTASYYGAKLVARSQAHILPMTYDFRKFNQNYRKGFLPWQQEAAGPGMNWKILMYPEHGTINVTSRVPIRTPAEFKGKLIRAVASQKSPLELIGGTAVLMEGTAVFEALQRGTIDGSLGSIDSSITQKWTDVANYVIYIDFLPATIAAVMPLDYYNALPADLRKIIDDASLEAESLMTPLVEQGLEKEIATLKKNPKMEVIVFTAEQRAQLSAMMTPFHDSMKKKYGKDWDDVMAIIKRDGLGY